MSLPTNARITSRDDLKRRIRRLKKRVEEQEHQLKTDVKEVHQSLQLSNMVRRALAELKENRDLRMNLKQTAIDAGLHFLVERFVLRKRKGLKSYLVGAAVSKLASMYLAKRLHHEAETKKE